MAIQQTLQMCRTAAPKLKKLFCAACLVLLALCSWTYVRPFSLSVSSTPLLPPPARYDTRQQQPSQADTHTVHDSSGNQSSGPVPGKLATSSHRNQSLGVSDSLLTSPIRNQSKSSFNNASPAELIHPKEGKLTGYSGHILQDVPPKEGSGRFLIFECVEGHGLCGGWADRQEGLVTVFLLAYLTHRRFGIRMTTPCDVTKFVVPNAYNWIVRDEELKGKSTRRIPAIDGSKFSREMPTVDFNAQYPEDVVFLQTNRDLLKDITGNPHYRDVLPPWARQARPEFFRDVWRTLMKPSPELEQRVEGFLQSVHYVNRTRPLLGVHVRTGGSKNFADGTFADRFSLVDSVLWPFVLPYVENGSDVFVATDNPDIVQSSRARFGSHHHDTQAVLRHIDRQRQDPAICQAFGGAILDQLILTRCDVLVVSPGSGFSGRAAMIRGSNRQVFDYGKQRVSPTDIYKMCDPIC